MLTQRVKKKQSENDLNPVNNNRIDIKLRKQKEKQQT